MTTVNKGRILRGDLALYDGVNGLETRRDSTGGTIAGLPIGDSVDVLQLFGDGENRTHLTINEATSRLGSRNRTLHFAVGEWSITANTTIASNFTCHIPAGCVFNVSAGATLTFSGPIVRESDSWTSGSGTVSFSSVPALSSTSTVADGAALVGYKHGGSTGTFSTGAESIGLDDILDNGRVDVLNFIPEAQRDAVIDGTTTYDASSDIGDAIDAGVPLWFGNYTIRIDSTITKALAARLDWRGSGATIKAGAVMVNMFLLSTPPADIHISGITFDGDTKSHQGIRINNTGSVYPNVDVEGATFTNFHRLTNESQSNGGIFLSGAYGRVWVRGSRFTNISRASGTTTAPGSSSTGGVFVFVSGTKGAQHVVIGPGNHFENMTNGQSVGDALNYDVDAVSVACADDGVNPYIEGDLLVYGNRFVNIQGRAIKGNQISQAEAHSNFIQRDENGTRGIETPAEIDFQGGHGSIHHNRCLYRKVTVSTVDYHPMANSQGVFIVSPNSTASDEFYGDASIHDNVIINDVLKAVGEIKVVAAVSVPATLPSSIYGASVVKNTVLGGAVTDFIRLDGFGGTAGALAYLKAEDNFATEVTNSLMLSNSSIVDARILASRNVNGVGTAELGDHSSGSAFGGVISGYGNEGYTAEARNLSSVVNPGAMIRKGVLAGDGIIGATLRMYDAGTVADDATAAIAFTGLNGNRALVLVWAELSTQACGMFAVSGTTIVDLLGGTSPDIAYGTSGTNPDTDVKLNIWSPDSTGFSIKNRLGSSRAFTFLVVA